MDEVCKRNAQFGAKGRSSSSYREMIDETFAYIVGVQKKEPHHGWRTTPPYADFSILQVAMKRRKTPPNGA